MKNIQVALLESEHFLRELPVIAGQREAFSTALITVDTITWR